MNDSRGEAPTSWVMTLAAVVLSLAFFVGWGGIMYGRSVPRFEQLSAGAAGTQGPVTMALSSLTTTTSFADVSGVKPVLPPDAIFVVAHLRVLVSSLETVACEVQLIDAHGHRWNPTDINREPISSCYPVLPNVLTGLEVVFVVPKSAVPDIAGVAMYPQRGVSRTPVLRPPV